MSIAATATAHPTAGINPYQSPHVGTGSIAAGAQPRDFARWRIYLGFHVIVVIATFVAAMVDSGHWRLESLRGTGIDQLAGLERHDIRYALMAIAELLISGAHVLIAIPLCQ